MNEISQHPGFGTVNGTQSDIANGLGMPPYDPRARLDRAALLEHFDNDLELLREIAATFLSHAPGLVQEIVRAAAERHPARLHAAAHSLKGSAANFGARSVVDAAYQLEDMGAKGHLDGAAVDVACAELLARMQDLQADLANFI